MSGADATDDDGPYAREVTPDDVREWTAHFPEPLPEVALRLLARELRLVAGLATGEFYINQPAPKGYKPPKAILDFVKSVPNILKELENEQLLRGDFPIPPLDRAAEAIRRANKEIWIFYPQINNKKSTRHKIIEYLFEYYGRAMIVNLQIEPVFSDKSSLIVIAIEKTMRDLEVRGQVTRSVTADAISQHLRSRLPEGGEFPLAEMITASRDGVKRKCKTSRKVKS